MNNLFGNSTMFWKVISSFTSIYNLFKMMPSLLPRCFHAISHFTANRLSFNACASTWITLLSVMDLTMVTKHFYITLHGTFWRNICIRKLLSKMVYYTSITPKFNAFFNSGNLLFFCSIHSIFFCFFFLYFLSNIFL